MLSRLLTTCVLAAAVGGTTNPQLQPVVDVINEAEAKLAQARGQLQIADNQLAATIAGYQAEVTRLANENADLIDRLEETQALLDECENSIAPPGGGGNQIGIYSVLNSPAEPFPGVTRAINVNGARIDADNDGRLDNYDKLRDWLRGELATQPDAYVGLDWEGPWLNALAEGPDNPQWTASLTEGVALLTRLARDFPLASFGFYALPLGDYNRQDDDWVKRMEALKPIYDASGALFPSSYHVYVDPGEKEFARVKRHIGLTLDLADGKPVIVYIHHRYHPSRDVGHMLVPDKERQQHIEIIKSIVVSGDDTIDGVLCWGGDWFYERYYTAKDSSGGYVAKDGSAEKFRAALLAEWRIDDTSDTWRARNDSHTFRLLSQTLYGAMP